MKLKNVKLEFQNLLKISGINDYIYDANFLIAYEVNCKISELLLIENITTQQYKKMKMLILKRSKRIPLQHIVKTVEFYNCNLFVNKNVLIPRHETEILVDTIINEENLYEKQNNYDDLLKNDNVSNLSHTKLSVLDLCCGSGCIGIALAKNGNCSVTLSDVSKKALHITKRNIKLNKVKPIIIHSDLFSNIKNRYEVIVSNPPYIKTSDLINLSQEVKQDPIISLDGKDSGYYFYEKIINQAPNYLTKNGRIYFEIGKGQEKHISKLLEKNFECIKIVKDYNGINRIIYGKLKDGIC